PAPASLAGLFFLAILALAPTAGAVDVGPNQNLTWGTGDLENTTLNQVNFTGTVPGTDTEPNTVKGAIATLKTAITAYAADPANPDKLSALNDALAAYNTAITDARNNGTLGTIHFASSLTLTATTGSADQRLNVAGNAASFDHAAYTSLTITGNNTLSGGGGAVSVGTGGLFAVTGDGTIVFDKNAVNVGGGIWNVSGTVSFAGETRFTGNSANTGGGINSSGTVSFAGETSFTGNTARSHGGGICNTGGTVNFAGPASFTNNSATSIGGGIYNSGTVSFAGETRFTGNSAVAGGGIYNIGGTVNLSPTNSTDIIRFSGNKHSFGANSIYMFTSGSLNVGGAGTIDMRDPMAGHASNVIAINKSGDGAWYLGGTNTFAQGGTGKTTFTVSEGTLHLYRTGEVDNSAYADGKVAVGTINLAGTDSSFTLGTGASLSLGGTGHSISAATIKLEADSTLAFDLAHHDANAGTPMLTLSNTSSVGDVGVDLLSLNSAGTYTLASGPGFANISETAPTFRGENITGTLLDGVLTLNTTTDLKVTVDSLPNNAAITWTGATSGSWNLAAKNWNDDARNSQQYLPGDAVTFTTNSAGTVSINAGGVVVSDMTVSGGDYTFSGGPILVDASSYNDGVGGTATGKLTLSGGSADFTGITGANNFAGGINISGGKLIVANANQLGTALSKVSFQSTVGGITDLGTVISTLQTAITAYAAGNITLTDLTTALSAYNTAISNARGNGLGTIQFSNALTLTAATNTYDHRLYVGDGKAASFHLADGTTLTITGNNYSGSGGAVSVGTGGLFAVTGNGAIVFEGNTATDNGGGGNGGGIYNEDGTVSFSGPATFTSNSATNGDGGGIYNDDGTVSFSGPATFTSNSASGIGGGGIYNFVDTVSFAGPASFTHNTARGSGGGIFNRYGTVSFAGETTFTGNTAGSGGGIYNDRSTVSFAGPATFTGNTARRGGGIFNENGTVSFSRPATFTSNSATSGNGGGIFSTTSVTMDKYLAFTGNSAGSDGGGIYSPSSVSLGSFTLMEGNSAKSGERGGGAVFSSNLSLSAHTLMRDNLAKTDGAAIYMRGNDATNTASLDTGAGTAAGAIAFTGNKSGVDFTNPDNPGGTANSIHLEQYTKLELKGDGNIYFDDPISSKITPAYDGDTNLGRNSLVKTDSGFVQFMGDNRLNTTGGAGNTVDIQKGTFRLAGNATFDATGAGAFNVATVATLAGSGTIKANGFTISGTISPDSDRFEIPTFVEKGDAANGATASHYNFFLDDKPTTVSDAKKIGTLTFAGNTELDGATLAIDIASASSYDTIAVTGNVIFSGTNTVAVSSGAVNGIYEILTASSDMTLDADDFGKITGTGADGYSYTRGSSVQLQSGNAKTLQLTLDTTKNTTLTWTGSASGNWHNTGTGDENWTDTPGGAANETRFMNGDTVIFDSTGSNKGVAVVPGGITVAGMTVSGDGYVFSGGKITGSGTLAVNESATFKNQFEFTQGASIADTKTLTVDTTAAGWELSNVVSGDGALTKTGS
ncbi:hypothetical protein LJC71_11280, partial [Desulfosarcina sp. OttesenSCG-928-A07]|nr:hypothetical protein [Desulfosarcina sp. OttesenSCG-928-A07]